MFNEIIQLIVWAAGVVTLLLITLIGVVAYFLRNIHQDFKELKIIVQDLAVFVKTEVVRINGEFKVHEQRMDGMQEDIRMLQKQVDDINSKI